MKFLGGSVVAIIIFSLVMFSQGGTGGATNISICCVGEVTKDIPASEQGILLTHMKDILSGKPVFISAECQYKMFLTIGDKVTVYEVFIDESGVFIRRRTKDRIEDFILSTEQSSFFKGVFEALRKSGE